MRIAYILLALLISVPIALSEKDSVTTGPFNVSFDLGLPKDAYNVTVDDPKEIELIGTKSICYFIRIHNRTGLTRYAIIGINDFQKDLIPTPTSEDLKAILPPYFQAGFGKLSNIETTDYVIDGKLGAIMSGEGRLGGVFNVKVYCAVYLPSAHTEAFIGSLYPWEEGTLALLKTIHIVNTNKTIG